MGKRASWLLGAGSLLAATACSFVGYEELLEVSSDTWEFKGASGMPDGRIVSLECNYKEEAQCRVTIFKNGGSLSRETLPRLSYFDLDGTGTDNRFLLGAMKNGSLVIEEWQLTAVHRVQKTGTVRWGSHSWDSAWSEAVGLAAGQDGKVYVVGDRTIDDDILPTTASTVARYTLVRNGSNLDASAAVHQTRFDGGHLGLLADVEVDQANGKVYVVTQGRDEAQVLPFRANLSAYPVAPLKRWGSILAPQAAEGLLAFVTAQRGAAEWATTVEITSHDSSTEFKVWDKQDDGRVHDPHNPNSNGMGLGVQRTTQGCADLWTLGKHSHNSSPTKYKVFGRHSFCSG